MSHYAIGDVQGCFNQLLALLEKINFDSKKDTLWFAGDLVNRGPASLEVLRFVKSLDRAVVVLGNHDLHLLAIAAGSISPQDSDTLGALLRAPDCDELCDWLRHQPLLHHDESLGYTLVHAGLLPQWDLKKAMQCAREAEAVLQSQDYQEFFSVMYADHPARWDEQLTGWDRLRFITNCLTRLRFCTRDGVLDLEAKGKSHVLFEVYMPWFKVPDRASQSLNILFGHWAALRGETHEPQVYALDTGCVWGGALTAFRLEDRARFILPCP